MAFIHQTNTLLSEDLSMWSMNSLLSEWNDNNIMLHEEHYKRYSFWLFLLFDIQVGKDSISLFTFQECISKDFYLFPIW